MNQTTYLPREKLTGLSFEQLREQLGLFNAAHGYAISNASEAHLRIISLKFADVECIRWLSDYIDAWELAVDVLGAQCLHVMGVEQIEGLLSVELFCGGTVRECVAWIRGYTDGGWRGWKTLEIVAENGTCIEIHTAPKAPAAPQGLDSVAGGVQEDLGDELERSYRAVVRAEYEHQDDWSVDDDARVDLGDDGDGAWVTLRVWVYASELPEVDESEDE